MAQMNKRRQKQPTGPLSSPILVPVAAAAVVLLGLVFVYALSGSSESNGTSSPPVSDWPSQPATSQDSVELPDYVLAAPPQMQAAYSFAVQRPDVLAWIPCYCGCGDHSGHKSAHNCFVKEGSTPTNIEFDPHGAGCDMCVGIALDTKAMIEEGKSLLDIRAYIDDKYGSIGPATDTPMPPG
jgi:hypothetical protein